MPAVAGRWYPAHLRSTPVGRGGIGSAGQRLIAGALSGLPVGGWALPEPGQKVKMQLGITKRGLCCCGPGFHLPGLPSAA